MKNCTKQTFESITPTMLYDNKMTVIIFDIEFNYVSMKMDTYSNIYELFNSTFISNMTNEEAYANQAT